MSELFLLYLFTRLDDVRLFLVLFVLLSAFVVFLCFVPFQLESDLTERPEYWAKVGKRWYVAGMVAAVAFVAVPSSNQLAVIVGGKFVIDAAKSDKAQELGGALYDAVMAQLKKAKEAK